MDNKIALGAAETFDTCLAIDPEKLSPEERILLLEQQMLHMQRVIIKLRKAQGESKEPQVEKPAGNLNKDGIPVGTICYGVTEKSAFLNYLEVEEEGYIVGNKVFASLSAAAEAVSYVRRSGWTFWKLLDGRTLKEAYRG